MTFPDFPGPLNSFFQTSIKCKHVLTNYLISRFRSFLAQLQNILFTMHGGSIYASHCVTQPNYATVTDNYAVNSTSNR